MRRQILPFERSTAAQAHVLYSSLLMRSRLGSGGTWLTKQNLDGGSTFLRSRSPQLGGGALAGAGAEAYTCALVCCALSWGG